MGKGDKRSAKGKRTIGSYGNSRPRPEGTRTTRAAAAGSAAIVETKPAKKAPAKTAKPKAEAVEKAAATKTAAKPAAKKAAPKPKAKDAE